jgi:hypothetical protein
MTHKEAMAIKKPTVPCAAWHITFGGRCLNCGWEPDREITKNLIVFKGVREEGIRVESC